MFGVREKAGARDGADANVFDKIVAKGDVIFAVEGGNIAHNVIGAFGDVAAEADFFKDTDEMIAFGLVSGAEAREIAIRHI